MKSRLEQFGLDLYTKILDNGLMINVVPVDNVNNIYVTFSTKYGSIHDEFIPIDDTQFYKVPLGVAHFLEHKVFEQEDGTDPFSFFSSNGADSNANTTNEKTTYLFSGPNNFKENINYLLDYVQNPYFTDENVEKEKGIIEQELKMLNDKPYWRLYELTLNNTFHSHPVKYPVGGTLSSIKEITKEDLYKCYNTFYHSANMFVTITGNIDPTEAIDIIEENQSKKSFSNFKDIILKEYDENDTVSKEYEEIIGNVTIPKVSLCYKISKKDYDINDLRIYLNLYFGLLLDSTSLLDEELRDEKLITNGLEFESIKTDKHIAYIINFESIKYQEVIEKIKKTIGIRRVTEQDINRKKKTSKSNYIYASDNIYYINNKINKNIIDYGKVKLDDLDVIDSYNINKMNEIIDKIDFSNISTVIIKDN